MNADFSHAAAEQPGLAASIPTGDALLEGRGRLCAAQEALAELLAELTTELNDTSALWGESARQAYSEAQRSWEASTARQQQIIAGMPAHSASRQHPPRRRGARPSPGW